MRDKRVLFVILLLIVIVMILLGTYHKRYKLQLTNQFTIPGITLKPQHHILDGYAISFALSDTLIYIVDSNDSTHTKSFCYDYSGKAFKGFYFPTNKGYGKVFVDRNLYYLPQSNMLAYNYWQKKQIDFYTTDGTYIRSENLFRDQTVGIYNIAEYNHAIYINSMGYFKNTPRSSIQSMRVYKEQSGQPPVVLKNIDITNESTMKHFSFRNLMLDDNGKDSMLLLENQFDKPHAFLFKNNTKTEFVIKTPFVYSLHWMGKLPFQVDRGLSKEPYQLVLGNDFLIIGSWTFDRKYPLVQRFYNLKGHYLGKLKFKDDKQNELIDIMGDRLVAYNPAKGVVSIYKIRIK